MRTRQASAKPIGTLEYFSSSFAMGSTFSENVKVTTRARRRSRELRLGTPGSLEGGAFRIERLRRWTKAEAVGRTESRPSGGERLGC